MDSNGSPNLDGQPLLDAVLDEQNVRWGQGDRPAAEEYFERFPALRNNPDAALDVIYHEFLLRRELGERPQPEEFIRRFPFLSKLLIIAQFAADEAMRSANAATEPPRDESGGRPADEAGASTAVDGGGPDGRSPYHSFPGYDLIGVIGQGGMGVVYKARNTRLGRVVALKTITELEPTAQSQSGRFLDEARAAARLQHPNIITVHEIGEHQGRPYFVQEFVDGGDLKKQLADKPMAMRRSAELLETLAGAVHAAHRAGIVHRDLKPSNILLTTEGVPKVADFGLAKLLGGGSGRTQSGQVVGTPSYMAPEQAEGRSKDVGPAADVYALGAILYEALTGRPPFLGDTQIETLRLVCSTEPVPPKQSRPDIPRDLETICLKCLDKEPNKRYVSAELLAGDLRRFLNDQPITARPVGPAGRLRRWSRRNPWVAALSAAVLMSLLVGTGVSTTLAIRAIRAEAATRQQRDQAELEANRFKAVMEFLRKDVLAQASANNQATRDSTPDPDLKVRTALDRAAATIGNRFAGQPLVEASIRQTIGETYHQLGLFSQARPHLDRAIELRRGTLGVDDPETFSALHSLGVLLADDGKWAEAERYLVPAMDGLRKTRGMDDLETLEAMSDVGNLYNQLEKTTEAETLLSQTVSGLRRTRGDRDILTLRTMDNLATVYLAQKKPGQAEQLEEEVVRGLREEVGTDNPYTLGARRNLAATYEANGKSAQAEPLLKNVLKDQRRVLGDKHPDTLLTMAVLAEHYMKHAKMDQVEKYAGEALEASRSVLNDKHQVRVAALSFLAAAYGSRGDWKKLESVMIEAVELARFRWGPDSDVTAQGNADVGQLLIFLGKYPQAEPYCREEAAFRIKHSPVDSDRFLAELRLGVCVLAQKRYTEARTRFLSAYNGMKPREKNALPTDTSDLGWIIEQITQLRDDAGKPLHDAALAKLRSDPVLKAIVFDLQFPANPFAP